MSFPNHPDKYDAEPLIRPEQSTAYAESGDAVSSLSGVVLCYSRDLMDYVTETYDGTMIDRYLGDLYVIEDTDGAVGVLGGFGIGGPTTAVMMEELIAGGVEAFLSVGYAGCLREDVAMGEYIVCERAIRDDGTSHHYVEPETYATPTDEFVGAIRTRLREEDDAFHVGPSWTTDAIYQETKAEIERYASEGVLTVEMEAATVFTVAEHRGVDAAAMFVVSDYLGLSEWEPQFDAAAADLAALCDTALELLTEYAGK